MDLLHISDHEIARLQRLLVNRGIVVTKKTYFEEMERDTVDSQEFIQSIDDTVLIMKYEDRSTVQREALEINK